MSHYYYDGERVEQEPEVPVSIGIIVILALIVIIYLCYTGLPL